MKIAAIRKNRVANGSRAGFLGSNSHSNENLFSRSSLFFFQIRIARIIMAVDNRMLTVAVVIVLFFTNFLIGSQCYYFSIR